MDRIRYLCSAVTLALASGPAMKGTSWSIQVCP